MDDKQKKIIELFSPHYLERQQYINANNIKFVQYTSAEAAMSIIKNKEVWLRNCLCMNDFSEVEHGLDCLINAFSRGEQSSPFQTTLESIFPGIIKEFADIFDSWIPTFKSSTFIACVSEHPPEEDQYGRLSMWRAYGGNRGVALVLNKEPFLAESDAFHAYTNPVLYKDSEGFYKDFGALTERLEQEKEFLLELGKDTVVNILFNIFKNTALSLKHPGFIEEREWRVVYSPSIMKSDYVESDIEVIDKVPQRVHKIPLKDIPEENFYGATVPKFIDKIIIGPTEHQSVMQQTFIELLTEAGDENAQEKVIVSGIPLR